MAEAETNGGKTMQISVDTTDEELQAAISNLREAGKDDAADWLVAELGARKLLAQKSVRAGYPDCPAAHKP